MSSDPFAVQAHARSVIQEQELLRQGLQLNQFQHEMQRRLQVLHAELTHKLKQSEAEGEVNGALKQVVEQVQDLQRAQLERIAFEQTCQQQLAQLQRQAGSGSAEEVKALKQQVQDLEARFTHNPVTKVQDELQARLESLQAECVAIKESSEITAKAMPKLRAQMQTIIAEAEQHQRYYEGLKHQLKEQQTTLAQQQDQQQALQQQFNTLRESLASRLAALEGRVQETESKVEGLTRHLQHRDPRYTVGEKILKLREAILQDAFITTELRYYIPALGKNPLGAEGTSLHEWVQTEFLNTSRRVLLLQGEAGAGKSTFNRYFLRDLWQHPDWQHFQPGQPAPKAWLPLFIALGLQGQDVRNLTGYVTHLPEMTVDFTPEEVAVLFQDYRLAIIADGYDELSQQQAPNLYEANQLAKYGNGNNIKLIIGCRTQRVLTLDIQTCFAPHTRGVPDSAQLIQREVAPFTPEQRHAYVVKYVAQNQSSDSASENHWSVEDYERHIETIPDLKALLTTPFLLLMTLEALPSIVKTFGQDTEAKAEAARVKLTRASLLDAFMRHWFQREAEKARAQGETVAPKELMQDYHDFCTALAEKLRRAGVAAVQYPYRAAGGLFAESEAVVDVNGPQGPWVEKLFGTHNERMNRARRGAPLLVATGNYYQFIHASLIDHFLTRAIAKPSEAALPALAQQSPEVLLTERLLSRDQLKLLADRVSSQPDFQASLFAYIERSKQEPRMAIAAANAASILNAADVNFSALDWRGVRLPHADLSGALVENTQLQGADLTGANLQSAWLRGADMAGATLTGIRLGAWPSIKMEEEILCCAYSPDSRWMAVTQGKNVFIVDTSTRKVVKRLAGHTGKVTSVAWDPTGERLASGSEDCSVRVWKVASGRELRCLTGHTSKVMSVAWDKTGERLASGSWDNSVRVWEVASGRELRCLLGHTREVMSVAWDATGERLASGSGDTRWGRSGDNNVRVWEVASGRELRCLKGHKDIVTSVAWDATGERLASGSKDNSVRVWEVASGAELRCLLGHGKEVNSVAWDVTGERIASGSWDMTVRVWEAASGRELRCLLGHQEGVMSVAWDATGERLASGSQDSVRVWEVGSGAELRCLKGHGKQVNSVAWDATGERLASGSQDNSVRVWEAASGRELRCLLGHKNSVNTVAWDATGERLASGSWDKTVRVWGVASGAELRCLSGHTEQVRSVAWDKTGERIASGSQDNSVRVWEVRSGAELRCLLGHKQGVMSVAWNATGERLASGSWDNSVRVWEVASGAELRCFLGHTYYVNSVAWDAAGERLASGSWDTSVRVWEVASGAELRCLSGHTSFVMSVAWDATGERLASGSGDNSVRVWEVATGHELFRLELPWRVDACTWTQTPQGKELLAVACGSAVLCYELQSRAERYTAHLRWVKVDGARLLAHKLNLAHTTGLSLDNFSLLQQHGAEGKPRRLEARLEEKAGPAIPPGVSPARLAAQRGFLASPPRALPSETDAAAREEQKKNCRIQ